VAQRYRAPCPECVQWNCSVLTQQWMACIPAARSGGLAEWSGRGATIAFSAEGLTGFQLARFSAERVRVRTPHGLFQAPPEALSRLRGGSAGSRGCSTTVSAPPCHGGDRGSTPRSRSWPTAATTAQPDRGGPGDRGPGPEFRSRPVAPGHPQAHEPGVVPPGRGDPRRGTRPARRSVARPRHARVAQLAGGTALRTRVVQVRILFRVRIRKILGR
jgi:hypothetical protein